MPTQRPKKKKVKHQKKKRSKTKPTGLRPNQKCEKGERPKKKKKGQRLKKGKFFKCGPPYNIFFKYGPPYKKFAHPWLKMCKHVSEIIFKLTKFSKGFGKCNLKMPIKFVVSK